MNNNLIPIMSSFQPLSGHHGDSLKTPAAALRPGLATNTSPNVDSWRTSSSLILRKDYQDWNSSSSKEKICTLDWTSAVQPVNSTIHRLRSCADIYSPEVKSNARTLLAGEFDTTAITYRNRAAFNVTGRRYLDGNHESTSTPSNEKSGKGKRKNTLVFNDSIRMDRMCDDDSSSSSSGTETEVIVPQHSAHALPATLPTSSFWGAPRPNEDYLSEYERIVNHVDELRQYRHAKDEACDCLNHHGIINGPSSHKKRRTTSSKQFAKISPAA